MQLEQIIALAALRGSAVIFTNIGAVATVFAELDVVNMPPRTGFEHKHQLVSASIKRTHPRIALDPDRNVFQLGVNLTACHDQLVCMAPIHTDEVDCTVVAVLCECRTARSQEPNKLIARKLARGLSEFAVPDLAFAVDVTVDFHVVGRVNKNNMRKLLLHQDFEGGLGSRIPTMDPTITEFPDIARLANCI